MCVIAYVIPLGSKYSYKSGSPFLLRSLAHFWSDDVNLVACIIQSLVDDSNCRIGATHGLHATCQTKIPWKGSGRITEPLVPVFPSPHEEKYTYMPLITPPHRSSITNQSHFLPYSLTS